MTTRYRLVLVRHGESLYTERNRFCGWHDSDLSDGGIQEAKHSAELLKKHNFEFDIAYTSLFKRAIKSLFLIQEELDAHWLPVVKSWRLCERHYGALQGLSKSETAAKYGEDKVKIWRRSYDVRPPPLERTDDRWPGRMKLFSKMDQSIIPACESLQDTIVRVLPFWYDVIAPTVKTGKRVIVVCHGSVLRGLIKCLDRVSDTDIIDVNVPCAIPICYELQEDLKPVTHYYLAPEDEVNTAVEKVINQGKAIQSTH